MNGEFFEVVEWRIENICAWSPEELYWSSISSPGTLQNKTTYFELHPRAKGRENNNFYLTIEIINKECANLSGDLSLIASDGYLLSFHLVNTWSSNEIFQGPKFKDVIARIRNSESIHKDYITMQCRFKSANPCKHIMPSSIGASEMSLKFDPQFIENLITSGESKSVAYVKCPFDKVEMLLKVEVNEEEEIIFSLVSNESLDSKWLDSCMSFLSSEGKIVRRETSENLLYEDEPPSCKEMYSLEKKDLIGKDITLLLHFKFMNDEITGYHSKISCLAKNVSIVPKNNLCFCKEISSDSLKTSKQIDKSVTVLSKDLLCLYQDKEFSDMQLKCEGVSFPVHRNILSARSPVFKRLLLSNMRETASGTVDIKDLDASTLSLFLAHLYAGTTQFAGMQFESCLKLYYAADKYDVPTLKRECTDFFRANISVSNVCDVLSLADKHQDDLLTISAYAFILRNLQEVSGSEEWKSFMKSEPLLVAELLTHFAQKKYVKSSNANLGNLLP